MKRQIGLLGNGGQANEIESYLSDDIEIVFKAVSADYLDPSNPKVIDIKNPKDNVTLPVVAAVGPSGLRKKLVSDWPGKEYETIISKNAHVNKKTVIGYGTVISPGAVITTDVTLGKHVIVNINATISHNCDIGDFATISPGVHIAGNVKIGAGAFIGIGATISNGLNIAPGAVIGAGAVIIDDINEENSVVVGNPGKVIKKYQDWLNEI